MLKLLDWQVEVPPPASAYRAPGEATPPPSGRALRATRGVRTVELEGSDAENGDVSLLRILGTSNKNSYELDLTATSYSNAQMRLSGAMIPGPSQNLTEGIPPKKVVPSLAPLSCPCEHLTLTLASFRPLTFLPCLACLQKNRTFLTPISMRQRTRVQTTMPKSLR